MLSQMQAPPFPADVMAAAAYSLMHEPWLYAQSYGPASPVAPGMPQQWSHSWSPPPLHKKANVYAHQPLKSPKSPSFVDQGSFVANAAALGFVDVQKNGNAWTPRAQISPVSSDAKIEKMRKKLDESDKKRTSIEDELSKQSLYKTELCRSFSETGVCRYGHKCQFAHGHHELRPVLRHPKYKTETCKTFTTTGICPYGPRCRFIHPPVHSNGSTTSATSASSSASAPVPIAANADPAPLAAPVVWSTSWPDAPVGPSVVDQGSSPPPSPAPAHARAAAPAVSSASVAATPDEVLTSGSKVTRAVQTQTPDDDDLHDEVKRLAIFETIAKNA
eukprot:TRINITY_DN1721_c0_g1_i1.p1 TRINITY_DN1721_c0_g1~~TRINITY_DN1721_c0_g1_i1.p1  ORF type:complete len:332 (+),score=67.63 TRINITY_DN1721_c0_g1_i1:414-1409(+)